MTRKMYYYCAYGNTIRVADKCDSAAEAAKQCFGVVDRVTCLPVGSRSPKYFTGVQDRKLMRELAANHLKLTGNDIKIADG